jgi:hypothetical protein
MFRILMLGVSLLSLVQITFSQQKTIVSVKTLEDIRIDGYLDDAAWQKAPIIKEFTQNFPDVGQPATTKTEVRVLYDNTAIYVSAYLYDNPANIRKQITARDGEQRQDVDYFAIFLDTYNDLQNGFMFLVTPKNVQSDAKIDQNANVSYGDYGDKSWEAVWESKTQMREDGWSVEMRIPYISLRFAQKEIQTWGLQFVRFTRRNNEASYWNPVYPNINGFLNQFGKLLDLQNIEPPLRLSFSPYISSGLRMNPEGSRTSSEWLRNGGMDVKYGLNESFTLDATLIPDFGQVISDNIINNLSPFEVQFQENRPFFTEGTELFNKAGLFYSRRVGAIPSGYFRTERFLNQNQDYELVKNPSMTQLYNAIKFSGRNSKKTGIGVFNAVTAPMYARLRNLNNQSDSSIQTEPLANYNIVVVDQALKGRSSITFTNTNVMRSGSDRDANVSSLDWSLYTNDSKYRLRGTARHSRIFGFTPFPGGINLIYDTITRNGRLYVKPYNGYNSSLQLSKVSGNLQFNVAGNVTSNTYDPNDLGFLLTPNVVNYRGGISYTQFRPTANFLSYRYSFDMSSQYLYKPYRFSEIELRTSAFYYFKNFWDLTLSVSSFPNWQNDYFELRTPGRVLKKPAEVTFGMNGSTDSRRPFFFSWEASYAPRAIRDNEYFRYGFGTRFRFSDKFSLTTNFINQHEQNQIGFAFMRDPNNEPIIGFRDFTEMVTTLSGIYNFTARLNLTMRTRHYWNKVNYNSFYNVANDGHYISRAFIAGRDENYNVFNLDAFLTWDFRLGSRIIVGWKNWLGDSYAVDGMRNRGYFSNVKGIFNESHGNELTLRVIYFLDYNEISKRKK